MTKINSKRSKLKSQNFRWVVPQLSAEIWENKEQYKTDLLDKLLTSKTAKKGIKYYSIAIESHADGKPHLDMLLILEKRTDMFLDQLDFLCNKHGNLTKYRDLNTAILDYGNKQDSSLNNISNIKTILNEWKLKKDPYAFLSQEMKRDPFNFDLKRFCTQNNYFQKIPGYTNIKLKLRDEQEGYCSLILESKPLFKKITPELITQILTSSEQEEYHSWSGYKTIIKYINDIIQYGYKRPTHTKQLYIVGKSRIGKTSLLQKLEKYCSVYPVGTVNWFPTFNNNTYKLMFWDECRLNMMYREQMLMLFDGRPFDLPYKGGSTLKKDNQLWIMCSNKTLHEQFKKMHYNIDKTNLEYEDEQLNALCNRIQELIIPVNKDLFLIQKLITI